ARSGEAGRREPRARAPARAAPRAAGGVDVLVAPSAARLAYRGTGLALPERRDRHYGAPRQGARGYRGQVAGGARHRGMGAGAAPAPAHRPRRRSFPDPALGPRRARPAIRCDAGGTAAFAAPLARRLARRRLANLPVPAGGGASPSLGVGSPPLLPHNGAGFFS